MPSMFIVEVLLSLKYSRTASVADVMVAPAGNVKLCVQLLVSEPGFSKSKTLPSPVGSDPLDLLKNTHGGEAAPTRMAARRPVGRVRDAQRRGPW